MGFAQAGVVAGEGKAVTSDQPRAGEKAATRQEASIRRPEKTAVGELRGEAFSAPGCDVQCRACRWWARLRIGSLGTIFFVGPLPGTRQLAGGAQAPGALDAGGKEAVDVILVGAGEAAKIGFEIDGLSRNRGGEETPDGGFAEADE